MSELPRFRAVGLGLAVLLATGTASAAAQGTGGAPPDADIVYVDSQEILRQAPGASEAQQTWSEELEGFRAEVEALASEIDSLRQSLESQREGLDDQALRRREREIQQRRQELTRRARELEERATRRREELLDPILQRVGAVIERIRAENGYDMVFDVAASGVRAAAPRLDVTDLVLERLRREAAGEDAASGGGSGS